MNQAADVLFKTFLVAFGVLRWILIRYFIIGSGKNNQDEDLMLYLQESVLLSDKITSRIKNHVEELKTDPIRTLNHPELLDLVQEAEKVDEIICSIDPTYKERFMPPKELHRHMVEIAKGMHKQTH